MNSFFKSLAIQNTKRARAREREKEMGGNLGGKLGGKERERTGRGPVFFSFVSVQNPGCINKDNNAGLICFNIMADAMAIDT